MTNRLTQKFVKKHILLACLILGLAPMISQAAEESVYTQRVLAFKVTPGKTEEFSGALEELSKIAQFRVNGGEINSWTVLRSVIPNGTSAKADYLLITSYKGYPAEPKSAAQSEADRIKSGSKMPYPEIARHLRNVATLVSTEIWQYSVAANGHSKVGDYVLSNYMRVSSLATLIKFETEYMKPLADHAVAAGSIQSWRFFTKLLPAGTDIDYMARTEDILPSFASFFSLNTIWSKATSEVHKGKDFSGLMAEVAQARKMGARELSQVIMRVSTKNN
jgi:hypothetical protein